jgi:diketogulonate reductase-like aldo/keto reductase
MTSLLLYGFTIFTPGLCQYQLKDHPVDTRSHLRLPPKLGLGTWFLDISVANTTEAVAGAIAQGYRHIDGMIKISPEPDLITAIQGPRFMETKKALA